MAETYTGAVDKGLEGVVACTTDISYIIDATLTYRGYTIEDLAENSTYEEVVYLLWNDRLPTEAELKKFSQEINSHLFLTDEQVEKLQGLPCKDVHPMAWLRTAVSLLSLWDKEVQQSSEVNQPSVGLKLVAQLPVLVALLERTRNGQSYVSPKKDKSLAWNFIYMLNGADPDEEVVKVMDTCLVLHADHELNCSAFASRVVASSLSDIYSAVVSGICALKGPLHGGANEQVMKGLKQIGSLDGVDAYLEDAFTNKKKIMGIGHRVYKNGDPRAKILKSMSESLCKKSGNEEYFKMSEKIETVVTEKKGLLPNVDFYSATVYYGMGIPLDLYTPIFATARVSGWLSHVFEQYSKNRIYRPRGEWVGKTNQKWMPFDQRS